MANFWPVRPRPRTRAQWVLVGSALIAALAEGVRFVLPPWDRISNDHLAWAVISLRDIGLLVAVSCGLGISLRHFRETPQLRTAIVPAAIALVCLGYIFNCAIGLRVFNRFGDMIAQDKITQDHFKAQLAGGDLPRENQARLSKLYASNAYVHDGVIIPYITPRGDRRDYLPTQDDRDLRQLRLKTLRATELGRSGMIQGIVAWSASLLVGLVVGLGGRVGRLNTQQEREPDA